MTLAEAEPLSGCAAPIADRRCTACGRPALLDAFSCAGGAGMGYHRAGFCVTGVDINPQPRYPFHHVVGDALEVVAVWGHAFAAIHASPPCQWATAYRRKGHGVGDGYVNLIPQTRALLETLEAPWVIENVEQARAHLVAPVKLCGSMFLREDGTPHDVQRHRMFEVCGLEVAAPGPCDHQNPHWTPRFPPATNLRRTVEVGVWRIPLEVQHRAMGIDWMTLEELSEAIPPAYTQLIGTTLLEVATTAAAVAA